MKIYMNQKVYHNKKISENAHLIHNLDFTNYIYLLVDDYYVYIIELFYLDEYVL